MEKTKIHTVYKVDEKRVPSVTTVLAILSKPALLPWAWQCGIDGLDYREVRDNAADIGTLAHYLIMSHLLKQEPDTSEYSSQNIAQAETCLIKFWDWEKEHSLEPILVEKPLVSEEHRFGGTIDFYGKVDDVLTLCDFKTGKAIYSEMILQLAGYDGLLRENGYPINDIRILRIGRNEDEGFEERKLKDLTKHWQVFYNCLKIYELQKEIRREKS